MSRFINTELKSESDSELDWEAESKPNTELMAKLKSDFDSELILLLIIFTHTFLSTLNKSFSCNVNELIKTTLSQYILFYKKIFHAQKHSQAKINQQNKNKLTLNNKSNNFLRVQAPKRVKVAYFTLAYSNL